MVTKGYSFSTNWRTRTLALLLMARPLVLTAAVLANLAGLSMAYYEMGSVDLEKAILGLTVLLLATLMGHYLNELADVDTDSLTLRTPISGGSGVLPSGIVPASWAIAGGLFFGLSSLFLTILGFLEGLLSISFVFMVSIGLALGYGYSMPPLQLEKRGWGELDNAFLGTLMFLSGYLPQTGEISVLGITRSIPIFLAILANLIGVHWADREADEAVGKRTIVVRLGERSLLLFLLVLATIYLFVLFFMSSFPIDMLVAYLLTLPIAAGAYLLFKRTGSPFPGSIFMVAILLANIIGWSI